MWFEIGPEVLRDVSDIKLRELMAPVVLILFAGTVVATYVIIFLWGFRKIELPNSFVHRLGAATVGQTAGMLTVILKDLFPGHPGSRSPTRKNKRTAATKTSEFPESQEL